MMRTISVVTINRNDAAGLGRTVQSLACLRAEPGIEFVFVDGASQDSSLYVARGFYRPEEIVSEPDRGIYDAMNKGLRRAHGDYVVWINSGDEFSGNLNVIRSIRNSSADILNFGTRVIVEDDRSRDYDWLSSAKNLPNYTLPHPSTYFRRNLVIELGGYDTKWRIVADRGLMVRAQRSGAVFQFSNEIAAHFYHGGISSSPACYLETIRLNHELGLIGWGGLIGRYIKYQFLILPRAQFGFR